MVAKLAIWFSCVYLRSAQQRWVDVTDTTSASFFSFPLFTFWLNTLRDHSSAESHEASWSGVDLLGDLVRQHAHSRLNVYQETVCSVVGAVPFPNITTIRVLLA